MISKSTALHRFYVRQRPACRYYIVIAPPRSLLFVGDSHSSSSCAAVSTTRQQQIFSVRRSSSVATNATEQHPSIPSSNSANNVPQTTSSNIDENNNNLPVKLIDFTAASKIEGEESHIATITLHPGETVRAESGSMIYMTEGVVLDTKLNGLSSAFSRMMTGQNVFLTDFRYDGKIGTTGTVCLGTAFPSKILRMTLSDHPHQDLICQKGAYMASNPNIQIEMEFTKSMTAGFFGGQGFILQKLSGDTDVLIKGGGTIVCKQLKAGESLRVTSGSLVCFESTVSYDVQMVPGITNAIFGGEGLFITTLQGPGQVWLQGMPPDRMIAEIASRIPSGGLGFGIPIPLGGGGGGGTDAGDVAAGAAGGAEEMAAGAASTAMASDAAIEADRATTVATSGIDSAGNIDSESPSALFGDAVAPSESSSSVDANPARLESYDSAPNEQPTFDDESSFSSSESNEHMYDDDATIDDGMSDDNINDGELYDDTAVNASDNVVEESQSFFRKVWDFFSDQE